MSVIGQSHKDSRLEQEIDLTLFLGIEPEHHCKPDIYK